jgi:hypothetical protein
MSDDTYTASFIGTDGSEVASEQLAYIDGLPQKSVMRPGAEDGEDLNWELDTDTPADAGAVYRSMGVAQHDYS